MHSVTLKINWGPTLSSNTLLPSSPSHFCWWSVQVTCPCCLCTSQGKIDESSACLCPVVPRCTASVRAQWRLCVHASLCLRPLHSGRALGGAGGKGYNQLCQNWILSDSHVPHQTFLRRESSQVHNFVWSFYDALINYTMLRCAPANNQGVGTE